MKLEQQVCGMKLAKRLEELGVKQESYFQWRYFGDNREGEIWLVQPSKEDYRYPTAVSAFTVAELGEMLPRNVRKGDTFHAPTIWFGEQATYIEYDDRESSKVPLSPIAGNEADARAEMLIYLIENNLIKL
jgi:hypothetical protein